MISMDRSWLTLFLSLSLCFVLLKLIIFFSATKPKSKTRIGSLPPGPPFILTIFSVIRWLWRDLLNLEPMICYFHAKYGPILTLHITSKPTIFISDPTLAHRALVHHGAATADREPQTETSISFAPYGPRWRLLRRNLTSGILLPSRIKQFADARKWALQVLLEELKAQAVTESGDGVVTIKETFQFSMFCLMLYMCFCQKLDIAKIREIEDVQESMYNEFYVKSKILAMFPTITKIVFRKEWKLLFDLRRKQEEMFVPLIRGARTAAASGRGGGGGGGVHPYVDSLLELSIPEEGGRRLTDGEVVSLCSEFLNAGIDTITAALEWIMAELVQHQVIQKRLWKEIQEVAPIDEDIEEHLPKMSYLKAVVLEGLRRHPPGHLLAPHASSEDVEIGGYVVPKGATMNFMVAEMGLDERVWGEPMEFRPERFLAGGEGEGVDITGSREIKMMPFGVGRRMCAGLGLAMLHLEYFVANLVREFEWMAVNGEEVDFSEKVKFAVVMKNHLRAKIVPRRVNNTMK